MPEVGTPNEITITCLHTTRPRGTLSTWPKKYSVPQNDLSWGTMYVLLCQTITKSVYLGVSTLY